MRIAILGTRGIPAVYGGFETFAEECGALLTRRGHRVTVYCRSHYTPRSRQEHRGVSLVVLPTIRWKYTDTLVHTLLSAVHASLRRYDVVLFCNAANSIFAWMPRLAGIPAVVNVDGIERLRRKWNRLGRAYYRLCEQLSVWLPNAIVTDARVIAQYYRDRYNADSVFIPYGTTTEPCRTAECLERLNLSPDGYFLYVSRLEPENNAHVVIAAFEKVRTARNLVIVGDAPYARSYIQSLKQTGDRRILFPGAIYGQGYRELQANAFCYIHATEVGGTHPALIEAMGSGNLIVANRTPENSEVLGTSGIFYERNSVADLAARLQEITDGPQRYTTLRRAALERARSEYSWDDVVIRYERLFESLCRVK